MKTNIGKIRLRVQETVDELFSERLIPFALTAYNLSGNGLGEYVVLFHDSRLHSIRFSWKEGEYFKEVIRAAVSDQVKTVSGSLMASGSSNLTPQVSLARSTYSPHCLLAAQSRLET
jgi:hypothetical protein